MGMTGDEFHQLLQQVQTQKTESQTLEIKAAHAGFPKIRETLSSFSNQDDGGILLFGVDEANDFALVGVYDAADLQKRVMEECEQMEPRVRALLTVYEEHGKIFVAAEIPPLDLTERPCFYAGTGRIKGSYVRVGDADKHMTEYEVYSYEAYRKHYQDDIRQVPQSEITSLDNVALQNYLEKQKRAKPNLATLPDETIRELLGLTRDGSPTLAAQLLFGLYPQAFFPQLCLMATLVRGKEIGKNGAEEARFLDNQRIEGTLQQMLSQAITFVQRNTRSETYIDPATGERKDRTEYPVTAVREILLNALIHRDYSRYGESTPVQLIIYTDRLEVHNPGGLFGRIHLDELGKVQGATRNPVLASTMEALGLTNRYSGIPAIRNAMQEYGLPMPEFHSGTSFQVILRNAEIAISGTMDDKLLRFCRTPRTRHEIAAFLGIKSTTYAIRTHVMPLVTQGLLELGLPQRPQSPRQTYTTVAQKPGTTS